MIKSAVNAVAPILAVAGGNLYGIGSGTLGTALLVIMALAVIVNQLWTLFEKARRVIRNPESDTSGLVNKPTCEVHRRSIGRSIDRLREEDLRQDQLNKDRFAAIEETLKDLRIELRENAKGFAESNKDVLRAVSRLEGKVN